MHQKFLLNLIVLVMMASVLSACGEAQSPVSDAPTTSIPAEYAGKTSPITDSVAVITEGKSIYDSTCSSCHGNTGLGDGPASASLTPIPASLVELNKTADNDYLFWRISEGKDGTSMVGWKTIFSEDQIWGLISYIRTFE